WSGRSELAVREARGAERAIGSEQRALKQRIDKWLWHARVVRTRSSAAALVDEGHVRLNGARVSANSQPVKAGDVITVALDRPVRVMKLIGFAERRGDADAARLLCEDLTPRASNPAAEGK